MNVTAPCGDYRICRRCVTGANEYRYDYQDCCVGSALALVAHRYPVTIRGAERTFHYEHDLEMTVFPGCSRPISCEDRQCARVVYKGKGEHCLEIGSETIRVISKGNSLQFYQNRIRIAAAHTVSQSAAPSEEWEHRQLLRVYREIPGDTLLLLLSFPLLQIWI